ncbi:MAG: hypothetical protein ACI9CP_001500 [Cryomorphaceae bacterium]|jgi:hypothetical protein
MMKRNGLLSRKQTLFFGTFTIILFATGIFMENNELISWKNYDYQFIQDYQVLNSEITSSCEDHGFLLLNDSIMVWGGFELISSTNRSVEIELRDRMTNLYGDQSAHWKIEFLVVPIPYRLVKTSSGVDFLVIKDRDTSMFRINSSQ